MQPIRKGEYTEEQLIDMLHQSEARRMQQATEIMALQADLSTATSKYASLWEKVQQLARDCDGHNMCWMNTERFLAAVGLHARPRMPPRDEFEAGCRAFQDELYDGSGQDRWPDFFSLATEGCD